jgi:uncharacterized protein YciW
LTQYQLGNYQDAADELEQATALNATQMTDDDRSKAYYTLGLARVQNDDKQGASEPLPRLSRSMQPIQWLGMIMG